jgi:hypothetical protein
MSIHGKVYCPCYQRDLWPKPPIPLSAIAVTGTGEVILSHSPEDEARVRSFQQWKRDACKLCRHRGQLAAHEVFYFGPWVSFDRAVKYGNWPVLMWLDTSTEDEDPVYPLEHTAELLQQLRAFRQSREVYWLPGVVNAETHELLSLDEKMAGDLRVWLKNGPKGSGEVMIAKKGECIFASSCLEIARRPHRGYTYRDTVSPSKWGEVFCPHSIIKGGVSGALALEVIPFARHGSDYVETLDPLERLCEAALATGHPIVWD